MFFFIKICYTGKNKILDKEESAVSESIKEIFDTSEKLLIGLGEEWRVDRNDPEAVARIKEAYQALYEKIKDKDYFIVTMAWDAVIFETALASQSETVICSDPPFQEDENGGCSIQAEELLKQKVNPELLAKFDQLFPKKEKPLDNRLKRISAPCGNETWRQCSVSCTKDIWELGEVPDDICPHCGAPLTGNTIEAAQYIEEGYLPQWQHYTQWLGRTFGQKLLILELGVGFTKPGVLRFPLEKTAFFNQQARLLRVHGTFPQIGAELGDRAEGIRMNSVRWIQKSWDEMDRE